MKSTASQSSSSGCEGNSPCIPISPAVFTRPRPKISCQSWFTKTLAVSGFLLSNNHLDNPNLFFGRFLSKAKIELGVPGKTSLSGAS